MNILVTGGLGYIGSNTAAALLDAGHRVVVFDDESNAEEAVFERIRISSELPAGSERLLFVLGDVCDSALLIDVMKRFAVDAVVHFAAKKAVGESVQKPAWYYQNNVGGLMSVLRAMAASGVSRIIQSSSATVYGNGTPPFDENMPTFGCNPYGWSKVMCERILLDAAAAGKGWRGGLSDECDDHEPLCVGILRYFNPLGAHRSGLLGENPSGIPNNLMPYIVEVATGLREKLYVFGDDYPTRDGTCERDYIHVSDVAKGHVLALENLGEGAEIYNLGTGNGTTVFEVIAAFEKATGVTIPFEIAPRRDGDIAVCYADVTKAKVKLGFVATKTILEMCRDHYRAAELMRESG
jgi:UDP-glucose 4-epimerase